MKKVLIALLAITMLLLTACGAEAPAAEEKQNPVQTEETAAPAVTEAVEETEETETPEEPTAAEIARSLIGEDISMLYAAIGEPESSDYASSCLGDGEDGNLYYDGFVVYTYRENGKESVYDVEG